MVVMDFPFGLSLRPMAGRPDAFRGVLRITAGQVKDHYRIPVILGRRGRHYLSASPMSSAVNEVTDRVCQARAFLGQTAKPADQRARGGTGPGARPANHLDQATIAHLPGHKTAKAIWASSTGAESRQARQQQNGV
jgi:hypothetical protein